MSQAASNRREFFRLDFQDIIGTMQIFEVDQEPVTEKPCMVTIVNISGGGLLLKTEVDLPADHEICGTFTFTLHGESFFFSGRLLRKLDDRDSYFYGVQFIDVDEKERAKLVSVLGRTQIERSRRLRA